MKKLLVSKYLLASAAVMAIPAETGSANPINPDYVMGLSGRTAMVHKKDAEGGLVIDAVTGQVLPGQHDRPEWAEGLAMAQLSERHTFYINRLGKSYADSHKDPEVFAFEDLSWLGVNTETGDEMVIEADAEHRMEVLGSVLGIDRETGTVEGALADIELAADNSRTDAEMADFRSAQEEAAAKYAQGGE